MIGSYLLYLQPLINVEELKLSKADMLLFVNTILNPPEPNEALRGLHEKYKSLIKQPRR